MIIVMDMDFTAVICPALGRAVREYLSDLGINLLYLTPIFEAESNHKYDTLNYKRIDPQFGSMHDFRALLADCHEHDIKLILDGVFNHTSCNHEWFKRAEQGIEPFVHYYKRNQDGYFIKWAGVETLPVLNYKHPDVRSALYAGDDSVVKYWLNKGIDGWRLDVAEKLGKPVIRDIKSVMKPRFSNRMLVGEVVETYGRDWLGPELLDGVMNYVFLGTTVKYLTGVETAETFLKHLSDMYDSYPRPQLYASWNIISTHDTNRMAYEVNGNENLFKMAVTLQFTYPGVPMIFYGDEIGLHPGKKDRDNRNGMDWDRVDLLKLKERDPGRTVLPMDWDKTNQASSIHFFYKHMIWMRNECPALVRGAFVPLYADENVLAFARVSEHQAVVVLLNRGTKTEVTFSVPSQLRSVASVVSSQHGPLQQLDLSGVSVHVTLETENIYVFVS
ncbi:MAG: alpha-amylase family glycosyl hydrolase [candidate division KSB1 bacterium]|nr:alpha-amylase family glycosyl hydrolase [candidate division KSB1 bacterium]